MIRRVTQEKAMNEKSLQLNYWRIGDEKDQKLKKNRFLCICTDHISIGFLDKNINNPMYQSAALLKLKRAKSPSNQSEQLKFLEQRYLIFISYDCNMIVWHRDSIMGFI